MTINGIPKEITSISASQVCTSDDLEDGRNVIVLEALDATNSALRFSASVWTGTQPTTVNIVEASSGSPVLQEVVVRAQLSDDSSVTAYITTSTGTAVFTNLPERTVVFTAVATLENLAGNGAGVPGTTTDVNIDVEGLMDPSATANKDFSDGLKGWTNDDSTVTLTTHVEDVGPSSSVGILRHRLEGINDNDLTLVTLSVEGPTTTSHAFNTESGTKAIIVRYRFITSEVPGGYFGSEFNDFYDITIRSKNGAGYTTEANTMNGLGLAAFDFDSGSTAWRYVTLEVDKEGDTVQVDATVGNVGDGLYPSQVIIDFIEEVKDYACVYTNTAAYFSDNNFGHAAILLAETDPDTDALTVTTWGLWPDGHEDTPDNGSGTDIRQGFANDVYTQFSYFYCEPVSEKQKEILRNEGNKDITWTCTNNCSSFASDTFRKVTGTDVDADDELLLGTETPVEMGKSIIALNGGSNVPAGGLPFLSDSTRRELVPVVPVVTAGLVSSFIGECFVFT